ncbi:MAG TPA: hypothetical protein VKU00_31005 [Chthonomonadaceae bacterium]|nr:hypothetical protein [Chthonomonadaceae bacterium]
MPLLNDHTLEQQDLPNGQYGFSATRLDDLGATEYTLVTIVCDVSPSVSGFVREMENALQEIVKACKFSPRADNLMLRLVTFHGRLEEAHGFKMLQQCNLHDYQKLLCIGSATALYDAAENCIAAIAAYGKQLTDADYATNGIVFVITDGEDNASTLGIKQVRDALCDAVQSEALESLVSILIGVNVKDRKMGAYLQDFKNEAGFTQYVELDKADAKTLAKLADFVSRSISAQSKSLGTGGASQPLTF